MKKTITYIFIAAILFLPAACSMDMDNSPPADVSHHVGFGVVTALAGGSGYLEITQDDGVVLIVTENQAPSYTLNKGQRVEFAYNYVESYKEGESSYKIKVYGFNNIVSKPILLQSDINKDPGLASSIGNDLINVRKVDASGEYINIAVLFLGKDTDITPIINLVYDDTYPYGDDEPKLLYLYYNSLDEASGPQLVSKKINCSFRLTEIMEPGQEEMMIKLIWNWEGIGTTPKEWSYEGVFSPYWAKDDPRREMKF